MGRKTSPMTTWALLGMVALAMGTGGCGGSGESPSTSSGPSGSTSSADAGDVPSDFVRVAGAGLVRGPADQPIRLQGVNLSYDRVSASFCGAGPWRTADHTDWGTPVTCWYQEKHFALLGDLGFNTVRLNLSYRIFEDNAAPGRWKTSGWVLLDQLVQWGRNHDLYLILDMHVAPGGAGVAQRMGAGYRTWDEPTYQARFRALWREIARRYATETQIAAYDLLNEPVPTRDPTQWRTLAQTTIDAIREVDPNHTIIVEMLQWIFDRNDRSPLQDFDAATLDSFQFLVDDPQVVYDYHFYRPTTYTLQYETGVDGGSYPDASHTEVTIDGTPMARGFDYLRTDIQTVDRFWKTAGVPANIGEWGTEGDTTRGGPAYTTDLLTLLEEEGSSWQFYFMNRLYDIGCCFDDNPTSVRSPELVEIFRTHFQGR